MKPTIFTHQHQTGAALVVSLMLLIVLTLLGLSGMQSTIMQERMSNNVRDKGIAFQAAESAARGAENWVRAQDINKMAPQDGASCSAPCNLVGLDDYTSMTDQDLGWWQTNARAYSSMPTGVVYTAPLFIIEKHSTQRDSLADSTSYSGSSARSLYRITSVGIGSTSTAHSMIETIYARID